VKNVFWIIPNKLAGRSGPDQEAWSLVELRAGGIGSVLNVSEFEPDWNEFKSANLDAAWIPLPNSYPATSETEVECLEILPNAYNYLLSHLEAGSTVLVHCSWGRDRTGLVLAHYLSRSLDLAPKEAISLIRQKRPKAITAEGWEDMAISIIEQLRKTDI
jgi:protein-tyrosine phosphatase